MKSLFLNSKIYLFLFCAFSLFACNNQITENSSIPVEQIPTMDLSKSADQAPNAPRVDSVLQFSVMVTAIFEDRKGNFWFGSHGDGLCRYDGKRYTYFTVGHGLPSGYNREFAPGPDWSKTRAINGGNQITSIQEDQNGNIWIRTHDKISKFNGQIFTEVEVEKESTLSTTKSVEEWKRELEYLWFSSLDKLGLLYYDGKQLVQLNIPPPYDYDMGRDRVSEIYKDQEDNIWFGTMENGTFRYDGKSFIRINQNNEIGVCRSIFQDNTGRTWITNNRFSLSYLAKGNLVNFIKEYRLSKNDDEIAKAFGSSFQAIEQDKNGDLWLGTFGSGLWRYDGTDLSHFTNNNSLPIVTVKTIYKDKSGKLWFGIGEGSVYGFNGKSFDRFDHSKSGL